ncbi:MAG: hypothetical protein CMO55_23295 [Verrucomicrobiales bacterium]|nr:hypothetical protein [Verrucomicrobiales bacterium]
MIPAFDLLHRKIQEAIWNQETKWERLRPLQEDSIRAVLQRDNDIVLAAATASGKTEAAFLPILSRLAEEPDRSGVGAVYVGPLKALINDQFRRLEDLCKYAEIPVHKWHGDVSATQKKKFRENPGGVLLITPESLESNFINYGAHLERIYSRLEFVVIDELHSFLEGVRGTHLKSLLARLRLAAGADPRMLGLSATLGDWTVAQQFLDEALPASVEVISPESDRNELKVGLRSYLKAEEEGEEREDPEFIRLVSDLAKDFRKGSNLIFTNSRGLAETLADQLQQISHQEKWARNPFRIHHGSISKEIREEVEGELKLGEGHGLPVTAFCTATLEMGIDIGAAKAVGQIGPTWSVNSLVQRVGRSGRREGESSILRGYAIDENPAPEGNIEDRFYPNLLRFCALIELMIEGWLEPLDEDDWHLSTLIHQMFSILRQTGGLRPDRLFFQLCEKGAFRSVESGVFQNVLRALGSVELIEQMADGNLILAPKGERIVESKDFYAAFQAVEEYSVRCGEDEIGKLPVDSIPPVGQHLLLGGRRWQVIDIDGELKSVFVQPSRGYTKPVFMGTSGFIHDAVIGKMREILSTKEPLVYLDAEAMNRIESARAEFHRYHLDRSELVPFPGGVRWFPWAGTKTMLTIVTEASLREIKVECGLLHLTFSGMKDEERFRGFLNELVVGASDPLELAAHLPAKHFHKYDECLDTETLDRANARRILDLGGTARVARSALGKWRK